MRIRLRTVRGGKKYCPKCDDYKDFFELYPRKNRIIPYSSYCKLCQNAVVTKSRHKTPEHYRHYRELAYIRNFGITFEQLEVMKQQQNNCCGICGVSFDKISPHV